MLSAEEFPRLLYIGDVPVDNSVAGAVLVWRLLSQIPQGFLAVACAHVKDIEAPLNGVQYSELALFPRHWSSTRFSLWLGALVFVAHRISSRRLRKQFASFRPQAVLTVSHATGWVAAWKLSVDLGLPLHLICHDDHAYAHILPRRLRPWAEKLFAKCYRYAVHRFCVSSLMAEQYTRRYGAKAEVMYPTRDPALPFYTELAPQVAMNRPNLRFVYAGSLHGPWALRQIRQLAETAGRHGHCVVVYSPQHDALREDSQTHALEVHATKAPRELIECLRTQADVLVVLGSFDPEYLEVSRTLFPSKMADYSAVGLPVLAWAPPESSVTQFLRQNPGCGELVSTLNLMHLEIAIRRLASEPNRRLSLALRFQEVGMNLFDPKAALEKFNTAIRSVQP